MLKKVIRIISKPHAHLQTMTKTPVKFQKDRHETVGGVPRMFKVPTVRGGGGAEARNHRTMERRILCPLAFLRKGKGQQHSYTNFIIHFKTYRKLTNFKKLKIPIYSDVLRSCYGIMYVILFYSVLK